VDADEYNSGTNGRTAFPVVADPDGTEVNQAYLERHAEDGPTTRIGRQRITLDNQRHVGNVGWRQREQTYDAASVTETLPLDITFTYAYLWNVSGVDGGDTAHDSHLVHARRTGPDGAALSVYAYLLNDDDAPATSSQTYGARYAGQLGTGEDHGVLVLEYADQGGYARSGLGHSRYMLGEIGTENDRTKGTVGYEVLGGDGVDAFQTPLATKHAFDGWADRFLTTPPAGLVDLAYTLSFRVGKGRFTAVWHDFSADKGGAGYGTEMDLQLTTKLGERRSLGAKYARYNADAFATDTQKIWVFAETSL